MPETRQLGARTYSQQHRRDLTRTMFVAGALGTREADGGLTRPLVTKLVRVCARSACSPKVQALRSSSWRVRYELEDGSQVYFESAEGSLVSLRSDSVEVVDAGTLGDRLRHIAAAADEVSKGLRERLAPEEIELEFGVEISGEVSWWFFAKASGEASINVTPAWRKPRQAEDPIHSIRDEMAADDKGDLDAT